MCNNLRTIKAYCYAAFSKGTASATEDLLTQYANEAMRVLNRPDIVVEKSYVDLCRITSNAPHPGWDAMLCDCKSTGVRTLIIPAVPLLSPYFLDISNLLDLLKNEHGIDVYFIRENFFTGTADVKKRLSLHFCCEQLISSFSVKRRQ